MQKRLRRDSLCQSDFPGGSVIKKAAIKAGGTGDADSIAGLGRSPGEGNGNLLQQSCLGNRMDRGPWGAVVHGVAEELNTT